MKFYNLNSLLPTYNLLADEIEKILLKVSNFYFLKIYLVGK